MKFRRIAEVLSEPWGNPGPLPTDKMELGEEARKLLDSPVLQVALERIEGRLINTWKHTEIDQGEAREATFARYWATQELRRELGRMIADAGMAARQRAVS